MRRGFDRPTSSSSPPSDSNTREHAQRTRQGRNDVPAPSNAIEARRDVLNQPSLGLPPRESIQPVSSERRSPAYLEGKNPYGQILEDVDHPYRRPRILGCAPSQVGATSEGRPRTSGSFQFKTRPEPAAAPKPAVFVQDPSLPLRVPVKSVSVKAVKEFFDSIASRGQSVPPLPYPGATAAEAKPGRRHVVEARPPLLSSRRSRDKGYQPIRNPSPRSRIAKQPRLSTDPPKPTDSPELPSCLDSHEEAGQDAQPEANVMVPKGTVCKVTTPQGSSGYEDSSSDRSDARFARRRSTNVFETASREASPLGYRRRVTRHSWTLEETYDSSMVLPGCRNKRSCCHSSDQSVRRRVTRESMATAEGDEGAIEEPPSSHSQVWRAGSDHSFRGSIHKFNVRCIRKCRSCSAPLTDEDISTGQETEPKSC